MGNKLITTVSFYRKRYEIKVDHRGRYLVVRQGVILAYASTPDEAVARARGFAFNSR